MPYSGPEDDSLPAHVKRMPVGKRRQWIAVFNRVMADSHDEGAAMRQANGAAKESLDAVREALQTLGLEGDELDAEVRQVAEKCGMDMALVPYHPLGGATSFAELDEYMEAEHLGRHVNEVTFHFQAIVENILGSDMDMGAKTAAISAAAVEMQKRADSPPPMVKERKGGILARLFGDKRDIPAAERDAASDADFAGPNRSFPILKPEDVQAAVSSMGRSDTDPAVLKRNIIRIAKRKGPAFVAKLPDSWDTKDDDGGSFTLFKDADDRWRWLAVYSNNFYDRDGEVFTEAAHKEFVDWCDRTGRYPELWLWHTPGSKVGKADMVAYQDGLALASGVFDPDADTVALALAADKDLGVSHGFAWNTPDLSAAGEYSRYRTFEISPLPRHKAANEGTLFLSEVDMELVKEKRDFLAAKLGPERVASIEENLGRLAKDLKDSGIAWKDFSEAVQTPPSVATPDAAINVTVPRPTTSAETAGADGGATDPAEAMKAFKAVITEAIAEAIKPVNDRLDALEQKDEDKLTRLFEPRNRPQGQRPSDGPALAANNAMAKEAEAAAKEAEGQSVTDDPMSWYKRAFVLSAVGAGLATGASTGEQG